MTELFKAVGFLAFMLALFVTYELSGKRAKFTGRILTKQRRAQEGLKNLFYFEIWYECPNGPNVYSLFVDESDFNRLWEGDPITFSARPGRLSSWFSPWLYNRRLIP